MVGENERDEGQSALAEDLAPVLELIKSIPKADGGVWAEHGPHAIALRIDEDGLGNEKLNNVLNKLRREYGIDSDYDYNKAGQGSIPLVLSGFIRPAAEILVGLAEPQAVIGRSPTAEEAGAKASSEIEVSPIVKSGARNYIAVHAAVRRMVEAGGLPEVFRSGVKQLALVTRVVGNPNQDMSLEEVIKEEATKKLAEDQLTQGEDQGKNKAKIKAAVVDDRAVRIDGSSPEIVAMRKQAKVEPASPGSVTANAGLVTPTALSADGNVEAPIQSPPVAATGEDTHKFLSLPVLVSGPTSAKGPNDTQPISLAEIQSAIASPSTQNGRTSLTTFELPSIDEALRDGYGVSSSSEAATSASSSAMTTGEATVAIRKPIEQVATPVRAAPEHAGKPAISKTNFFQTIPWVRAYLPPNAKSQDEFSGPCVGFLYTDDGKTNYSKLLMDIGVKESHIRITGTGRKRDGNPLMAVYLSLYDTKVLAGAEEAMQNRAREFYDDSSGRDGQNKILQNYLRSMKKISSEAKIISLVLTPEEKKATNTLAKDLKGDAYPVVTTTKSGREYSIRDDMLDDAGPQSRAEIEQALTAMKIPFHREEAVSGKSVEIALDDAKRGVVTKKNAKGPIVISDPVAIDAFERFIVPNLSRPLNTPTATAGSGIVDRGVC